MWAFSVIALCTSIGQFFPPSGHSNPDNTAFPTAPLLLHPPEWDAIRERPSFFNVLDFFKREKIPLFRSLEKETFGSEFWSNEEAFPSPLLTPFWKVASRVAFSKKYRPHLSVHLKFGSSPS